MYILANNCSTNATGELAFNDRTCYALRGLGDLICVAIFTDADLARRFEELSSPIHARKTVHICKPVDVWRLAQRIRSGGWFGFVIDPTYGGSESDYWFCDEAIDSMEQHLCSNGVPLPPLPNTHLLN